MSVIGVIFPVKEIKKLLSLDGSWVCVWSNRPVLQSQLLLFLSKEVTAPHTHPHTSHFLTPADPSTPMCVTQGGDSQRWHCRQEGTQAISICLCPPAFSIPFPPLSSSVAFAACCIVTHWPMTGLVSDSHQSTFLFNNDSYRTIYDLDMFKILKKIRKWAKNKEQLGILFSYGTSV